MEQVQQKPWKRKRVQRDTLTRRKTNASGVPLKQKAKPGRVVRLTPEFWSFIAEHKRGNESIDAFLRRQCFFRAEHKWALPSDLFGTLAEAKGEAILRSVRSRKKSPPESPVKVPLRGSL